MEDSLPPMATMVDVRPPLRQENNRKQLNIEFRITLSGRFAHRAGIWGRSGWFVGQPQASQKRASRRSLPPRPFAIDLFSVDLLEADLWIVSILGLLALFRRDEPTRMYDE